MEGGVSFFDKMSKVIWITGCSRGLGKAMSGGVSGARVGRWQDVRARLAEMGEGHFESVDVCDAAAVVRFL